MSIQNNTRNMKRIFLNIAVCLLACAAFALPSFASESKPQEQKVVVTNKQLIGPTATIEETESDLDFKARVDTGATTSSLHVEEWKIEDEAESMADNVGKTIRIRLKNHRDESQWITRKIVNISTIKTSERQEDRYIVRMTLRCNDVKKRVLVSLNDRSHMNYPALLGRNFLRDDFVVDVSLKKGRGEKNPGKKNSADGAESAKSKSRKA